MKIVIDLGNGGFSGGWLSGPGGSRRLAEVIKPILQATVQVNRSYLRANPSTPMLYRAGVRYRNEPIELNRMGIEMFDVIPKMLQRGWGDCFPVGTLVLAEGHRLTAIEDLEVGDRIWGLRDWVTVEAVAAKGVLPTTIIELNNGSRLELTADHHVYALECPKHGLVHSKCLPSTCPLDQRREVRLRVSELAPRMVLTAPDRLPFGADDSNPDLGYLRGLYVADGWSEPQKSRFSISGKDGHPKETQKQAVRRIAESLGIPTRWHERYIAVNDRALAIEMAAHGHHAPEKQLLSLDLSEALAVATYRGLMADSGLNTNGGCTFSSTSRVLATQFRVLSRMFGKSTGYRFLANHGGLGQHPIHRVNVRDSISKSAKTLRVKAILPGFDRSVIDLTTSDHHVYLPEHDVTVSQCDDLGPWRVAELQERFGEPADIRIQWKTNPGRGKLYHIVVRRGNVPHDHPMSIEDPSRILGMKG